MIYKKRGRYIVPTIKKKPDTKVAALRQVETLADDIKDQFDLMEPREQIKCLTNIGVGTKYFTCQRCGKVKTKDKFHSSTAAGVASGIVNICKQCAEDIAMPVVDGIRQQPTKESVDEALYILDKPMLESVWDASILEAANQATGKTKNNVYTSYIKNIAMPNYYTLTYRDSDNYTGGLYSMETLADNALPKDQEIIEQFEKNKNDTLRLLGYLPFEKEKLSDQPFLYSQLIGFLDSSEEGNDDMMRISSIISIVRSFLQLSNIDDMIATLSSDPRNAEKNISTIRALQQMKSQVTQGATKLAEQSCISLKNSKNSVRGENTWSGRISRLKDINLRNAELNGFDINTCKGMQQVANISANAIMDKLSMDESEWAEVVKEQRVKLEDAINKAQAIEEAFRIVLRENLDFRDILKKENLFDENSVVNLDQLINTYIERSE